MDPYFIALVAAVTLLAVAIGWYRDRDARRSFEATLKPDELEELRSFVGKGGNSWHDFATFRRQRSSG